MSRALHTQTASAIGHGTARSLRRVLGSLRVVNVVATADLSQRIALERLSSANGALYDPDVYPCVYLKQEGMVGKVSVFASGRMISYGTARLSDARRDLNQAAEVLERVGAIHSTSLRMKVQNLVCCVDLEQQVNLQRTWQGLPPGQCDYDPEQFPGLVYRVGPSRLTVLLFRSGKVVCVGGRTRAEVLEGIGRALTAVAMTAS